MREWEKEGEGEEERERQAHRQASSFLSKMFGMRSWGPVCSSVLSQFHKKCFYSFHRHRPPSRRYFIFLQLFFSSLEHNKETFALGNQQKRHSLNVKEQHQAITWHITQTMAREWEKNTVLCNIWISHPGALQMLGLRLKIQCNWKTSSTRNHVWMVGPSKTTNILVVGENHGIFHRKEFVSFSVWYKTTSISKGPFFLYSVDNPMIQSS